jgi:membrane-associated phospholipid phosphatase
MKSAYSLIKQRIRKHLLILKDCKPVKPTLQRFGAVVVFYLFSLYIMSVTVVVAGMRYPRQGGELPDLGFAVLPALHKEQYPNKILMICLFCSLVRFIFHRKGITMMRRFMAIHAITALLRCVTLVATSYPDPSFVCRDYQPADNPTIFWKTTVYNNLSMTCGDLMPSGHTLFFIILALIWHRYCNFAEKCIFWVLSLAGCLSLIVTRLHYTNDVLIAVYVAITVSYIYNLFATDPNYRAKSFVFSWLEADLKIQKEGKQLIDRNVHIVCTV